MHAPLTPHGYPRPASQSTSQTDPLYTRVKQTYNKWHYSIRDVLQLAKNMHWYENRYIPIGPAKKGVSLWDFILKTVHEGLGHFSAYKCYFYGAWFFSRPQMCQNFILFCRSCDKCQINNEPTTLPYGRALTLPHHDEAYHSLAIEFARHFNKPDGYTSILVIMYHFTLNTHLIPLMDASTSQKIFKKLNSTIHNLYNLPRSIVLDQDSRFTCKFCSQMIKSLGIQVWMATYTTTKSMAKLSKESVASNS